MKAVLSNPNAAMNSSSFSFPMRLLVCLSLFLCPVLTGCGGRFSGPSGPAAIKATAALEQLETGQETTATAVVTDFSGRDLPKETVTWESSEPSIATVTPTDEFGHSVTIRANTDQIEGQTTITARAGDQSAQIFILVSIPF